MKESQEEFLIILKGFQRKFSNNFLRISEGILGEFLIEYLKKESEAYFGEMSKGILNLIFILKESLKEISDGIHEGFSERFNEDFSNDFHGRVSRNILEEICGENTEKKTS